MVGEAHAQPGQALAHIDWLTRAEVHEEGAMVRDDIAPRMEGVHMGEEGGGDVHAVMTGCSCAAPLVVSVEPTAGPTCSPPILQTKGGTQRRHVLLGVEVLGRASPHSHPIQGWVGGKVEVTQHHPVGIGMSIKRRAQVLSNKIALILRRVGQVHTCQVQGVTCPRDALGEQAPTCSGSAVGQPDLQGGHAATNQYAHTRVCVAASCSPQPPVGCVGRHSKGICSLIEPPLHQLPFRFRAHTCLLQADDVQLQIQCPDFHKGIQPVGHTLWLPQEGWWLTWHSRCCCRCPSCQPLTCEQPSVSQPHVVGGDAQPRQPRCCSGLHHPGPLGPIHAEGGSGGASPPAATPSEAVASVMLVSSAA